MPTGAELLAELTERGLLHDSTDPGSLADRLDSGPVGVYCGFDPTADSLHIGNLQSLMLLRRFQVAGHAPIALVGGATGMIGDPSGRSSERQFLDTDELDRNRASIGAQLSRFLDFDDSGSGARLVDNRQWTEPMSLLDFLRDVGKFVTVNTMLAKDSVKSRLDRESGISFTEFSYMLLQANDFHVLHRDYACDMQVAGSDQWGNITAGVDLVRRRTGEVVHGLTAPLITRADGTKFGKSEGENIWLSAERTSPYRLYQYFLNVADDDIEGLLLRLTLVPIEECREIATEHREHPERRVGQRRLAREITSLVHDSGLIEPIEAAAGVLFGAPIAEAGLQSLELLCEEIPTTRLSRTSLEQMDLASLFVEVGLAKSKGEFRRNTAGYYVNQVSVAKREKENEASIGVAELMHDTFLLLQRGKNSHQMVVLD
ncbi:MAG TPA: tyrosine--tRNA ligase [Microthrixaceae bacterium]|nr:tyrosine--tRNA ligase [Microthrixaceae bacterium]